MPFVTSTFVCKLYFLINPKSSLLFITPRLPLQLSPFSLSSGCEEVTPVHLRSVHASTSSADAHQLPRNDRGDCECSRTQDPLRRGQTHSFSWCRLKRGLCDSCVPLKLWQTAIYLFLVKLDKVKGLLFEYKLPSSSISPTGWWWVTVKPRIDTLIRALVHSLFSCYWMFFCLFVCFIACSMYKTVFLQFGTFQPLVFKWDLCSFSVQ